ncbi:MULTISPECIES: 1,2-phenylacetyl-CoA epoxidase subunit PaaE [unclassified Isoptericola]|uniref:1,2-phenylacetyl-CoA epoxidase subunit PaaE n=1 Tax=unclassified Isoptericola TaxID=2623355 RepID=UPI002713DE0A|nr:MULTISPECIES: 1,2-phenylacetyl-CoA epoxidase subunit PaaE [unclassified Isoptericola]MDO8149045.1 1,2-phenylacetyl-CoA epoxidase subunit PaaE [Isoptericola sp. b515]MDO8151015.1 1,2-phenylacetyl-CoA epoxidase subunit PaaE [Isoptericola sp. b408]
MATTTVGAKKRATFHELRVAEVRRLTGTSVEVTFEVPEELADAYRYLAGQYLALRTTINGEDVRRSYSICRPPADGRISVAVKRDHGGLFSTWANDELRAGDTLQVMTPQGAFTSNLTELDGRHVVGIAAGSGITPVITMAHQVLQHSATSRFDLLFTNRSSHDVMFVEELADLKDRYPRRFAIHHVLSREQRSAPIMSGRLDEERLRTILTSVVPVEMADEWVLCGPFELVQLCRDLLDGYGVDAAHVRYELFTTGEPGAPSTRPRPVEVRAGERTVTVDINLDGTSASVESPLSANETILNAALRVRPDAPFACTGGVCGTCRARVLEGSVTMTENYALEPDEVENGYVLTCQSHPQSDHVAVDYDA